MRIYLKFVQLFGNGPFLSELDEYYKRHVPTGRIVPVVTFGSIVDLKLAPNEIAPHMAMAIVKAQASCEEKRVQNKVCRFISSSDISSLVGSAKKKAMFIAAEALLRDARGLVKAMKIDSTIASRPLQKMDTLAALLSLGKPSKFASIEHIGNHFVEQLNDELVKAGSKVPPIVSPWAGAQAKPPVAAASSLAAPNMLQYDEDGRAVGSSRVALLNSGIVGHRLLGSACHGCSLSVVFVGHRGWHIILSLPRHSS